MANLYFPQLASGAMAQYPVRKSRVTRSLKNSLPDGTMLVAADPGSQRLYWQLSYVDLSLAEIAALQNLFYGCSGRVKGFTFIDPTDNMLSSSTDFTAAVWSASSVLSMTAGIADPLSGTLAFTIVNNSGSAVEITQTLSVPARYEYCFSIYARCSQSAQLTLTTAGATNQQAQTFSLSSIWNRFVTNAALGDIGTQYSVSISIAAGQTITLFGPQLEAQIAPSSYKPTFQSGGVYPNAHWAMDELAISTTSPNLFSTSISIETSL